MDNNYITYIAQAIQLEDGAYVPVYEMIKEFRSKYPRGQIYTKIITPLDSVKEGSIIIFEASVYAEDSTSAIGIGHSQIIQGSGKFASSALEVCETSAVGRALRHLGIGLKAGTGTNASEVLKSKATANAPVIQRHSEENKIVDGINLSTEDKKLADSIVDAINKSKNVEELKEVVKHVKDTINMSKELKEFLREAKNLKIKSLKGDK